MDVMFWVWLGVIVVTAILEFVTMELVSIWFTAGAIIPFIMAATNSVRWEIQLAVFVVLSAILVASLRSVTKKFLLRNSNEKTNINALIGQKHRMLSRTDFETIGSVRINDVVWSVSGEDQQTIEKDEIVEIVKVEGNKLIVKKVENETLTEDKKTNQAETEKSELKTESLLKEEKKDTSKTPAKKTVKKTSTGSTQKKAGAKSTEKVENKSKQTNKKGDK